LHPKELNDNLPVVAVRFPLLFGFVDIVTMFPTPPGPGCGGAPKVAEVWLLMIREALRGCWLTVLDEQVVDTVFTTGTLRDLCKMLGDPAAVELDTIMTYITKPTAAYSISGCLFCGYVNYKLISMHRDSGLLFIQNINMCQFLTEIKAKLK